MRSGARVLVDALLANEADRAFAVPGESYIAVLDALYAVRDRVSLVVCRHESGAGNMAEAYGKLTGRPGIAFVTRGPGACNASVGVHTARQDSTPMILFVGQVTRGSRGRDGFQEIDLAAMFGPVAKWAAEIDDAARIPEFVARAYAVALSGRPGPVVLGLPEDMLVQSVDVPDAPGVSPARPRAEERDLLAIRDALAAAHRPLVVVGGGRWSTGASADLAAFAAANALPVAVEFRCQDFLDNEHPCYVGDLGLGIAAHLSDAVRESDLVVAIGARLGDVATNGYRLIPPPASAQRLVHVLPDPADLGLVYCANPPITADPVDTFARLRALPPIAEASWHERTQRLRAAYLAARVAKPPASGVDLGSVIGWLREHLPDDTIVTNGAGNYTTWVHRLYSYRRYGTQLAPRSGAMGYGLPAAIAAKLVHPERTVVCFAGDGCLLMTGSELATAAMYETAIVVIVVNNGMYGTIRMHQERNYPGRVIGTDLRNPDFAAFARSFGAYGEVVEEASAFPAAFERARAAARPALLELRVDRDVLTPRLTISDLRQERS